jgi:putative hydrolase
VAALAATGNLERMDDRPDDNNPFKGTPFEQIFNALGGTGGPGGPAGFGGLGGPGMPDLSGLMGQMQAMMAPYDGPVNWTLATDIARRTAAQEPDPSPDRNAQTRVADAMRLADHWLDDTTVLPSGVTTTAAWSRAEWIEQTTEVWRVLVEPVAEHVVAAMGNAMPEEARAMAGPLIGMLGKAGGAMFGSQVGAALGGLAGEVLTASDVGLPLGPAGKAALLPHNIDEFAQGLDVSADDVLLYLSLREAAHQRLFAHVPWLRQHLISSVEDFGRGVKIDVSGIEQAMGQLDPGNLEAIQDALQGGLFDPQQTPEQTAALARLETTLALVEGWVDEVVSQATAERMPAASKMQEAIRRRRAAGGPAEQTFAALVGLELRPRRLRDASALWGSLRSRQGKEERDAVWAHPDLLPTAADLDDPLGFREDLPEVAELSDEDFDKAIGKLLDTESGEAPRGREDEPGDGPGDGPGDEPGHEPGDGPGKEPGRE